MRLRILPLTPQVDGDKVTTPYAVVLDDVAVSPLPHDLAASPLPHDVMHRLSERIKAALDPAAVLVFEDRIELG
jgi:hypothetical protein